MLSRLRSIAPSSLRAKLFVMTVGPLLAALVIAGILFLLAERASVRRTAHESLVTVAQILASNSTAALVFGDTSAAEETLQAVAARRGVVLARLYDVEGRVFAEYRRPQVQELAELSQRTRPADDEGASFHAGHLHVWQSILLDGEPVGSLHLVSTLEEVRRRRQRFVLLASFVLAVSAVVAILVSTHLQQLVLRPVGSLVRTARAVSEGAGYSLRVDGTAKDELGLLVGAFNHMMESIEERDAALQAGRIALEQRVERRTADLRLSAERLQIRHQMDRAILSARSPEEIARAVLARISLLVPCAEARVTAIDPLTGTPSVLATEPISLLESAWAEWGRPSLGDLEALRRGEIRIGRPSGGRKTEGASAAIAFVDVPMLAQGELIGVLSVGLENVRQALRRHGRILNDLAMSLAIAIRQAWLFEQTAKSAETQARLLEEINHRVKNNLTSIVGLIYAELRSGRVVSEDCREVLAALRSRVEGLGTVHSMLSASGWAPLPACDVAQQVVRTALQMASRSSEIALEVHRSPLTVTSRQANGLAIVLNELATNVVKYAAAESRDTRVRIDFEEQEGSIVLVFCDDGPGYPDDVLAGERRGLGLYLVEEMVRSDLRGDLELSNEGGARASIRLPNGERRSRIDDGRPRSSREVVTA